MIASIQEDWQWSVYEYHRKWVGADKPEGFLVNELAEHGHFALCAAARYFSVDRTLPKHPIGLHQVVEGVLGCIQPNSICDRRDAINMLADEAADIAEEFGDKRQRPISAMSKFLMLRFPVDSFVYDNRAKRALANAAGIPMSRLNDVGQFFVQWKEHAYPMIQHIADEPNGIDAAGAARIVDKFLWLKGDDQNDDDHPIMTVPAEVPGDHCQWVMDTGTEIWNQLCEQGLTAPPEDAQH